MTTARGGWNRFRDDVLAVMSSSAPEQFARLTWSSEPIRKAQHAGLQLLSHAVLHSPFHQRRLAGIDVATVDPADLSALPVMSKAEMMSSLDEVFTDRSLKRRDVESAVAATDDQSIPILDDFIALASGGCSGHCGLFVFDRAATAAFACAVARPPPGSAMSVTGGLQRPRIAMVPATLPMREIVDRLNALQPPVLGGYPSMLVRLAAEAGAGRLQIAPAQVNSASETLVPEMRAAIREAFGVPVLDGFGSSEGLVGKAAPDDDVLVFKH